MAVRWCFLLILLLGCSPRPPSEPPTVGGVLPGTSLSEAIVLLPPASAADDGHFQLQDAKVEVWGSRVATIEAQRLDVGETTLKSGASKSDVKARLGAPRETYERDAAEVWLYEFDRYRYQLVFAGDSLTTVEVQPRTIPPLPGGSAPYGVGAMGSSLPTPIDLAVDGLELGMTPKQVSAQKGAPDDRVTGPTLAYGKDLSTFVTYGSFGATSIVGKTLQRDGRDWVTAGVPALEAQEKLATVARLDSQSASEVTYTFLEHGVVGMHLGPDGKIQALELSAP